MQASLSIQRHISRFSRSPEVSTASAYRAKKMFELGSAGVVVVRNPQGAESPTIQAMTDPSADATWRFIPQHQR